MSEPRTTSARLRAGLVAGTALATAATFTLAAAQPAQADPLPAPYTADAHADVVGLTIDAAALDLADVYVGHAESTVDSTAADDNATAESANLEAALVGLEIPPRQRGGGGSPERRPRREAAARRAAGTGGHRRRPLR
ncbi:hypothetical protein [Nocardioides sp. TF02-7]|uniref:hypothetical protein n=1 Tax=Nocardioides sp. TF02-7 TaxID=2917724 RepID=UPI001F05DB18|nr:hypothetical protein [Nocardioides sp. TF02-7]UMG92159.1 hypothetical protein MF408_19850 [Nocardioides sp. TF02-7]